MIYTHVPYRSDANLGRAYNDFMALLAADDWAIMLDHDATPTTGQWFRQFEEAIAFVPQAGAIVAMVNRCARPWQRIGDRNSNDIAGHRQFGAARAAVRTLLDITDTRGWAGACFAVSRAAWQECGGFVEGALGCTDHSLHYRLKLAGRRSYLAENIYLFHWRHFGSADPTASAPKAPGCPCMSRPETYPTMRIALP